MTTLFIGQQKWVWLFKEAEIWGGMFVTISFILKIIYLSLYHCPAYDNQIASSYRDQDSHQIIKKTQVNQE